MMASEMDRARLRRVQAQRAAWSRRMEQLAEDIACGLCIAALFAALTAVGFFFLGVLDVSGIH